MCVCVLNWVDVLYNTTPMASRPNVENKTQKKINYEIMAFSSYQFDCIQEQLPWTITNRTTHKTPPPDRERERASTLYGQRQKTHGQLHWQSINHMQIDARDTHTISWKRKIAFAAYRTPNTWLIRVKVVCEVQFDINTQRLYGRRETNEQIN